MNEKQLNINKLFLTFMIISILLIPTVRLNGLPGIRLEQLFVAVSFLYLSFKVLTNKKIIIHNSMFSKLLFMFSVFIIISIINGVLNGFKIIPNDFFELYKVFIYLGIFLITSTLIINEDDKRFVLNRINICIFITCLVSFTQYFNFFNLNETYVPYMAPTQYETLVDGYRWPRVIGLSDNPNVYAVIVSIGCLISIGLYLYNKKRYHLIIFIANFITLLMTRSRSGFIFFIISIVAFVIIHFKSRIIIKSRSRLKNIATLVGVLSGILLVVISALIILPEELTWRIKEIFDLKNSTSWQARLTIWEENLGYFKDNPILGVGPAKSVDYKFAADNEWLFLLKRYGLVGTIYFIAMFTVPIIKFWKQLSNSLYGIIYIAILVGAIFYMIPVVIFHSFQLMSLVMMIAGISFSSNKGLFEIKLKKNY